MTFQSAASQPMSRTFFARGFVMRTYARQEPVSRGRTVYYIFRKEELAVSFTRQEQGKKTVQSRGIQSDVNWVRLGGIAS